MINKTLECIKQNEYNLQFVKNQTEEICLVAVQKNGWTIQYINKKNQTKLICLAAVRQNMDAIFYIDRKYKPICRKYLKNDIGDY